MLPINMHDEREFPRFRAPSISHTRVLPRNAPQTLAFPDNSVQVAHGWRETQVILLSNPRD